MDRNIFINDILENTANKSQYRILWISPDQNTGFWIHLNPGKMPEEININWLRNQLEEHFFEKTDGFVYDCVSEDRATNNSKMRRDKLWSALGSALENEPAIFDKRLRKGLLINPAKELETSYTNLYPYLILYWSKGKSPNAFLSDYRKCGRKKETGGKRRGRPVAQDGDFGKNLDEKDLQNFSRAVSKYYLICNDLCQEAICPKTGSSCKINYQKAY